MTITLKTLSALAIAAATLTTVTLASGSAASAHPLNGAHRLPLFKGHYSGISCLACNLPRPQPKWNYYPWRFHHYPWRNYGWEHRYDRWYWERYRYRHQFGFERPFGMPASVASSAAAPSSAGPQACVTEHKMPDGSVVFEDICKQISAVAPPPSADPQQQAR